MDTSTVFWLAVLVVVVASSAWVGLEELRLRGRVRHSLAVAVETKPLLWAGLVLGVWPIFFVLYLAGHHSDVTHRLRAV